MKYLNAILDFLIPAECFFCEKQDERENMYSLDWRGGDVWVHTKCMDIYMGRKSKDETP